MAAIIGFEDALVAIFEDIVEMVRTQPWYEARQPIFHTAEHLIPTSSSAHRALVEALRSLEDRFHVHMDKEPAQILVVILYVLVLYLTLRSLRNTAFTVAVVLQISLIMFENALGLLILVLSLPLRWTWALLTARFRI
ncbi:MAG: hypothetical protein LQ352_002859 [Teloschistes flavicans]|nr:MAG: hypothetical protein LQ352_002859 [Teloschistes flavicans]